MNLFGKILTVIILLLSIVFSVVAVMVGATYKNWKQEAQKFESELKVAKDLNVALQEAKLEGEKDAEREKVSRAHALAVLHSKLLSLTEEVQTKEEQLAMEKQKATIALANSEESLARTKELDENIAILQKEKKELIADVAKHVTDLSSLRNQNFQLQGELNNKEERSKHLIARIANYARILKAYDLDEEALTAHIEPNVDTRISSVADDIVVIEVGRDDGVRIGHTFTVYRGNKYVGQVQVTKLNGGNKVTARITQQILKFRTDDTVVTEKQNLTSSTSTGG